MHAASLGRHEDLKAWDSDECFIEFNGNLLSSEPHPIRLPQLCQAHCRRNIRHVVLVAGGNDFCSTNFLRQCTVSTRPG